MWIYISRQKSATVQVVRQSAQGLALPVSCNTLHEERRELPLKFCDDREVERLGFTGHAMAQDGARLARVVVAVMAKEHDAPTHLRLQPTRGLNLGNKKAPRKEPAGLLAKGNDRLDAHAPRFGSVEARDPRTVCSSMLKAMHAAQPMRLYQR